MSAEVPQPETQHPIHQKAIAGLTVLAIGAGVGGVEKIGTTQSQEPTPIVQTVESNPTGTQALEKDIRIIMNGDVQNEFENDFQTEQDDTIDTLGQIDALIEAHKDLFAHPESIQRISITGLASAEDEGVTDEQLTSPSEQNQALAINRGALAKEVLVNEILRKTGVDVSDKIAMGAREDMLSETELQQVTDMVTQFGYDSSEQMIEAYNNGADVPPDVEALLDNVLASRRGAEITIETALHEILVIDVRDPKPKDGKKHDAIAVDRYEGYIPTPIKPPVYSERRSHRKEHIQENSRAKVRSVPRRIQQPRTGNGNTKTRFQGIRKKASGNRSARGHRG